ncbi:MAG: DUF58 domain-containing protein [Saprospiraceae bacterium]
MSFFDNYQIRELSNLELLARQVVEGFIIGLHKSPFHGFSVEFAEHRLYNQGESTKNIDWKVYARSDKLFVKRFEEETNLRCQIVIDVSSSMYFPEPNELNRINKIKYSALGAASLMYLLQKQRDAFGLSLFDESVVLHTHTKSSTSHYRLLLSHLEALLQYPKTQKRTSVAQTLHQIADSIHKRSLVVIFSDMFEYNNSDETDAFMSALQHLKFAKHEVILFHVVDKQKEINFDFENRPYLFIDMETGEEIRLQSNQIKQHYIEQMQQYLEAIKLKCLQNKIDFVEADINQDYQQVLQAYLYKRTKMHT